MSETKYPGIWFNKNRGGCLVPIFLASRKKYYYHNYYSLTKFGVSWVPEEDFTRVAGEALVRWEDAK